MNKIESLVAEEKQPPQAICLHALTYLSNERIMDVLAVGGGSATNAVPAFVSQGGCTASSLPGAVTAAQAGA